MNFEIWKKLKRIPSFYFVFLFILTFSIPLIFSTFSFLSTMDNIFKYFFNLISQIQSGSRSFIIGSIYFFIFLHLIFFTTLNSFLFSFFIIIWEHFDTNADMFWLHPIIIEVFYDWLYFVFVITFQIFVQTFILSLQIKEQIIWKKLNLFQ